MTATRHHADILVAGHSLAAALAAVLARKRGAQVVWAGTPPPATTKVGTLDVHRSPCLFASFQHLPALSGVLDEVGLAAEISRALVPQPIQILDADRRLTCTPADALVRLASEWAVASKEAPRFKLLALSSWRKRRARLLSAVGPLGDEDREIVGLLTEVSAAPDFAMGIGAAPTWLPGGVPWLVHLLWKRFGELGGRTVGQGLKGDASKFRYGWSGVELELGSGEQLGARAFIVGVDDPAFAYLASLETRRGRRLLETLTPKSVLPLWRLTLVVKRRGLPEELGAASLFPGAPTLLLERHPGPDDADALSVYWRASDLPDESAVNAVRARLEAVLPFFDRHIVATDAAARVPYADRVDADRPVRLARRVLLARTPAETLTGPDGAALLATGLSELALRLAPRDKPKT